MNKPKKVYPVIWDFDVLAIFSDRKAAEEFAARVTTQLHENYHNFPAEVQEFVLDQAPDYTTRKT